MQPRSYRHKDEMIESIGLADGQQYGFVAQELEKILPSLVVDNTISGKDGTNYKGINHQQLVPILTQAIKELSKENDTLQEQVDSLENRLAKLEAAVVDNK